MKKSKALPRWDDPAGRSDPTGSSEDEVRVLLECAPEHSPAIIASLIERHGYAVRTCTGPRDRPCDLLERGSCALVDGADVVVNMLGNQTDDGDVLEAVAGMRRPPAVVAEVAHGRVVPEACTGGASVTAVAAPMTRRTLLDGIVDALTHTDPPITPPSPAS